MRRTFAVQTSIQSALAALDLCCALALCYALSAGAVKIAGRVGLVATDTTICLCPPLASSAANSDLTDSGGNGICGHRMNPIPNGSGAGLHSTVP